MNVFYAFILGIVQGLTEFLPVSSSGHLALLSSIFGIEENGLFFSVMVHMATLIAVVVVLRKDIWEMLKHPFSKMTWMLVVATVPIVLLVIFAGDAIDALFSTIEFLGFAFLCTAIILTVCEVIAANAKKPKRGYMTFPSAIVMGLLQAVAIVPGISRSGSSLSGGIVSGTERNTAARFAFLMSIPAILGSFVLECAKLVRGDGIGSVEWLPVLVGMAAAGISGFLAVRFMLKLIAKRKLYGFAIYTFALGVLLLLNQYVFHVAFI